MRSLFIIVTILLFSGATFAREATRLRRGANVKRQEVLVKFKESTSLSARSARVNDNRHTTIKRMGNWTRVATAPEESVEQAMAKYSRMADVEAVQPNYVYQLLAVPNDPQYGQLWGLSNRAQPIVRPPTGADDVMPAAPIAGSDISAVTAWDINSDCSRTVVAVIDSGVNYTHEDLRANLWNGGAQFPNHGYNFVNDNTDPMDGNGHGTHVAGTIGAVGNNGIGTTGVCWKAQIMALKVFDATGSGTTDNIVDAVNFAVERGAKVLNMSFGGTDMDQMFLDALEMARENGVLVIVAAGNETADVDEAPVYPCAYDVDNIVCVAALDQGYGLANFSNFGETTVHVGAPGVNILSSWAGRTAQFQETMAAGWTFNQVVGVGQAIWGLTVFNNVPILANPPNWNNQRPYQTPQDSRAIKSLAAMIPDISVYRSLTVDMQVVTDLENTDVVSFYCGLAADPIGNGNRVFDVTGTVNVQTIQDISRCIGPAASLGFRFLSVSNATARRGAAFPPLILSAVETNAVSYNVIPGTSMATPHVVGVAALVWSYNPLYGYKDVIEAIKSGGVTTQSLVGRTTTGKSVNARGSLAHIQAPTGVQAQ